ncbi:preprotein translocase subunit SecA [bacterium]|nr:preprotein translocase subunit SecA [bacterium]
MSFLSKLIVTLFGDPYVRRVKEYWPIVDAINALGDRYSSMDDATLAMQTEHLRGELSAGKTLDDILPEAFAVVREAASRVLGMRHFDVQLIGGMVLHQGKISEMKTGEGKTLVSTLPAYLNALDGKGVYVVTVNDYLAKRDSEWMGQVFRFLGLTVGLIQSNMSPDLRLAAYACDITYGTNNEFGFDYLRDHLAHDLAHCCQTRRHFAIVDEVDSILIDEARTPLIISGPVGDTTEVYSNVSKIITKLKKTDDFTVDEKHKNIILTESGVTAVEKLLGVSNLYAVENIQIPHIVLQSLKALYLFRRDVDYVVKDGEVVIVDEFTGRLMEGRRYSDGLHQAIEAMEGVKVQEESQTLASITFQNYFRMFPKLAGMTGTAITEEAEFHKIYNLEVVVVPTHMTVQRSDLPDLVYKSKLEKYRAIVNEIKTLHAEGKPVLVGTISIENSETLSQMLRQERIAHNVLNAKYHDREAEIISGAGQRGAVTIATNMAGRGTDIKLGDGVTELGGLVVIGSERHESRRIDNQLRGRSGRQGDPGVSRFFVSLEDDLMRLFGSDRIIRIMESLGMPDDTPIEHSMVTKSIERAQSKVEKYHFGIRKQIIEYDDVMNRQRESIYQFRREILAKTNLDQRLAEQIALIVNEGVKTSFVKPQLSLDEPGYDEFVTYLSGIFPIENVGEVVSKMIENGSGVDGLIESFVKLYDYKKSQLPDGLFESVVTTQILLQTLDRKWIDHLHNMDVLREGIGLRAYGQREPLVEYKIEAYEMYQALLLSLAEEAVGLILKMEVSIQVPDEFKAMSPFIDLPEAR